jgi:succinate dehydrogenase / fumarate reductase cytochrome b subunit
MRREQRPVFLNLLQIKLPFPGLVSIAHRVSGVLLFLAIPLSLYLLAKAVSGASEYQAVREMLLSPTGIIILLPLTWSFWHHLLSGIRFLLMELDIGLEKHSAMKSAQLVLFFAPVITLVNLIWWYS